MNDLSLGFASRRALAATVAVLALSATAAAAAAGAASVPGASAHPATAGASAAPSPATAAAKKAAPQAPAKLVDINGASAKELATLPGVDDALARKIIANRPYLSKAELVTKGVIPEGPYLQLKSKVVALQKAPPKKPQGQAAAGPASSPSSAAAGAAGAKK